MEIIAFNRLKTLENIICDLQHVLRSNHAYGKKAEKLFVVKKDLNRLWICLLME